MQFTHLHTHTEYSLLDGLAKIDDLLAKTKEYNMNSLAITDHGSMHGVIEFYTKARKAGIKPIIGMEGYLAKRSRFDKEAKVDVEPFHIVLLAKNFCGYQNLIKLSTRGHLEGHYYKPRLDKELLREKANGLICLSACIEGEIPRALINGQYETARKLVAEYLDIFGRENFFLEIQKHQIKNQETANKGVLKLAQEFNVPIVATNDIHYVEKNDAFAQDALLALQTKQTINDPKRKLTMIDSPTFYLRSPQEMQELFNKHPEALENTQRIVDMCNLEINFGDWILPQYEVPNEETPESLLRKMVIEGARRRYGKIDKEIKKRLEYEFSIIEKRGYATYFLIVQDMVNWARNSGIAVGPGRGSAAGSVVSYSLGITNIDPFFFNLSIERFLNPERPKAPDIDLDFADNRRDEVIDYVRKKYGEKKVAQIITFGRMEARAAVRDIVRALGYSYGIGDKIAKMIPFGHSIRRAIDSVSDLKEIYNNEPETKKILDLAEKVEGVARHASVHAAGVVISDQKLTNYVPLQREPGGGEKIITQYDMYSAEKLGLLKVDFLGLRNLSILQKTSEILKKNGIREISLEGIPLDDQKTFQMLAEGKTAGVFQLETSGMSRYIKELKPTNIFDLMAMVALYRPGPMKIIPDFITRKNNPEKITYLDERLKSILDRSYGLITFQDDVLQIATKIAGYSWAEADELRHAMSSKAHRPEMKTIRDKFVKGCIDSGLKREKAEHLYQLIEPFGLYGFNKAHAACYALLAYQTAYLKANYPVEYMTALLSCEARNEDKIALIVNECRRMGISVLPPDVNYSGVNFEIEEGSSIRFGLSAIKNVGQGACEAIVAERKENGLFTSLSDFCRRVNLFNVNKKVLESLIRCGAMDEFGPRAAQLKALSDFMNLGSQYQRRKSLGQAGLFESSENEIMPAKKLPEIKEFPQAQLLAWEKELLGFYLSEHPKEKEMQKLQDFVSHPLSEVSLDEVGKNLILGGMIGNVRIIVTRKGNKEMAFVRLQDEGGSMEAIVFPKVFEQSKKFLKEDEVVLALGRIDHKEESDLKILVNKMVPLAKAEELISEPANKRIRELENPLNPPNPQTFDDDGPPAWLQPEADFQSEVNEVKPLEISVPVVEKDLLKETLGLLKSILTQHPGQTPVVLLLQNGSPTPTRVPLSLKVLHSEHLLSKLQTTLKVEFSR